MASLASCHSSILQVIIDKCDPEDLFLIRQVSRGWRTAVDCRSKRLRPRTLPADLGARFPRLVSLDLELCDRESRLQNGASASAGLSSLQELFLSEFEMPYLLEQWQHTLPGLTRLKLGWHKGQELVLPSLDSLAARCSSLRWLQLFELDLQWAPLQAAVAQLAGSLIELHIDRITFVDDMPPLGLLAFNTGKLRTLHLCPSCGDESDMWWDDVCRQLAAFTSLFSLALGGIHDHAMAPEDFRQLNSLVGLTCLEFQHCCLGTAAMAEMTRLTRLRRLAMRGEHAAYSWYQDEPWDVRHFLASFLQLEDLELNYGGDLVGIEALTRLTRLTLLETDCWAVCVSEDMHVLRSLQRLQDLSVRCGTDEALASLTALRISIFFVDEDTPQEPCTSFDWLGSLPLLRTLCLSVHCKWALEPETIVQQLAALQGLRSLSLELRALSLDSDVRPLECLPCLALLHLPPFQRADQLPAGLRVAFMKGRRQGLATPLYMRELLYYTAGDLPVPL